MLKILVIAVLLLFVASRLLPRLGSLLGQQARKPARQARWMWSWFAGSEAEALEAERDYGRECAREFARDFAGAVPDEMQRVVSEVGGCLARAVNDPRREFQVTVVASPKTNAYALPGGFIFVTRPLLELCVRRDEVAFLVGHEMGHILRGHAREQLAVGTFLNAVTARLAGAGQMLREVLGKGYSRDLELEADREAVRLGRLAGFDPAAGVALFTRLAQFSPDPSGLGEYFATHPPFAERVREVEKARRG